jgi:hypothetical protein
MAYIEPCCAERQLPALIRESRGLCFFQTAGDVTIEKLYQATASLVSNDPQTMLLVVPEADLQLLRFLAYAFRRSWLRALLLLTQTAQKELVETELQPYLPAVHYAADPMVLDGLCVVASEQLRVKSEDLAGAQGGNSQLNKALILQGPVLSHTDPSVCQYVACLTTSNDTVRQATDAAVAKLRLKPLIDHRDHEAVATVLKRQFV